MDPKSAIREAAQLLAKFPPDDIFRAAQAVDLRVVVKGRPGLRPLAHAFPDGAEILAVVQKGSTDMAKSMSDAVKASGVRLLAQLDPAAAAPLARVMLTESAIAPIATAAAYALTAASDDASLDLLFSMLRIVPRPGQVSHAQLAAKAALGHGKHPQVGARALALLVEQTANLKALAEPDWRAYCLLSLAVDATEVLGKLGYPPALPELKRLAADHPVEKIKRAAATALADFRTEEGLEAAAGRLDDPDPQLQRAAIEAVFKLDVKRAYDRLRPFFEADKSDVCETDVKVLEVLEEDVRAAPRTGWFAADKRWRQLCADLIDEEDGRWSRAWQILAHTGDVRTDFVLARMASAHHIAHTELAGCLFLLDGDAVPALEREAKRRKDKSDVAALRGVIKRLKEK